VFDEEYKSQQKEQLENGEKNLARCIRPGVTDGRWINLCPRNIWRTWSSPRLRAIKLSTTKLAHLQKLLAASV
jgi:hypothetical protein